MDYITKSPEETVKLGQTVAASIKSGCVILLEGNLGSGKTTFVQGFARELGLTSRVVSPTFILMRTYNVSGESIHTLCHIDLYRLESDIDQELENLGISEYIHDPQAVVLVEWAEKAERFFPTNSIRIRFEYCDENTRKIGVE